MQKATLPRIISGLQQELPGWQAQKLMTPLITERYRQAKPDSKQAGVVALLYPEADGELHLVYIKRTAHHPDDKHGGQISFPGGQAEAADKDIEETALRELEEELGITRTKLEVLGSLTPLYVYVSDFLVHPFLAYTAEPPEFDIEVAEVAYPITWSIQSLIEQPPYLTDIHIRGGVIKDVPYYKLDGEVLWGATAMMTSEILELAKSR